VLEYGLWMAAAKASGGDSSDTSVPLRGRVDSTTTLG